MVLWLAGISPRYEDDLETEWHTREEFQREILNLYKKEVDGEDLDLEIEVDCANYDHLFQIRVCKTRDTYGFKDYPYIGDCPIHFRFLKYRIEEEEIRTKNSFEKYHKGWINHC